MKLILQSVLRVFYSYLNYTILRWNTIGYDKSSINMTIFTNILNISFPDGLKSNLDKKTNIVERKNCSSGNIPISVNILNIPLERGFLETL